MTVPPDATEQRYLDELLSAMRGPCDAAFPAASDFVSENFAREFRATLLIHHYFLKAPLATNSFEAAFIRAAQAAGHKIKPAPDGQRFWDVEMDGKKISLKSTAAASLREQTLHISKLTEAAWIQDMRGAAQREEETKNFLPNMSAPSIASFSFAYSRKKPSMNLWKYPLSFWRR